MKRLVSPWQSISRAVKAGAGMRSSLPVLPGAAAGGKGSGSPPKRPAKRTAEAVRAR